MPKIEIKRIDPKKMGKLAGVIWAFTGGAIGGFLVVVSVVGFILGMIPGMPFYPPLGSLLLIAISLILTVLLFVIYGAAGWVLGWAAASIYNYIAKRMGGLILEVEQKK